MQSERRWRKEVYYETHRVKIKDNSHCGEKCVCLSASYVEEAKCDQFLSVQVKSQPNV